MRILILATRYYPEIDGMVRLIHNHAVSLSNRKHHVDLVMPQRSLSSQYEVIDGVHVVRAGLRSKIRGKMTAAFRLLFILVGIWRLRKHAKQIDVIYSFGLVPGICGLIAGRFTRSKMVLSLADITDMSNMNLLSNRVHRLIGILLIFPTAYAKGLILGHSE